MGQNISWNVAVSPAVYSISRLSSDFRGILHYEEYVQKKNKTKQNNQSQKLKQNLSEFGSNKYFPRRNEHLTWKMKD